MKNDGNADLQNTETADVVNDSFRVSDHVSAGVSDSSETAKNSVSASCSDAASFSELYSDTSLNSVSADNSYAGSKRDQASDCCPEFCRLIDSAAGRTGKSDSGKAAGSSGDEFCRQLPKMIRNSFLASAVLLPLIWLGATHLTSLSIGVLGLLMLVTSFPVFCYLRYRVVIRKRVAGMILKKHSLFSWFNSRTLLATIGCFVLAIAVAWPVLSVLSVSKSLSWADLVVLSAGFLTMYCTYLCYGFIVSRQYENWLFWFKSTRMPLLVGVPSLVMFCLNAASMYLGFSNCEMPEGTLAEVLAARKTIEAETGTVSVLVNVTDMMDLLFREIGAFFISVTSEDYHWLVKTVFFSAKLGVLLILPVTFLIPLLEYRRILVSPIASSELPKIGSLNGFLCVYSVPAVIFMLVIVYMEAPLNQYRSESLRFVDNNVRSMAVHAEKIKVIVMDGIAYPQDLVEMTVEHDRVFVAQREELEKQIDSIREELKQKMYANVDTFLDNYYTLTAEYLRMFGGSFLEALENSLMLETENCFARLGDAQGQYREYLKKFVEAKDMILENRRIGPFDPEKHEMIGEISVEDYIKGDYGLLQSTQFRGEVSALSAFGAVPVSYRGSKILIGKGVTQFGRINFYRKELESKITSRVMNTSVGKTASKVFGKIAAKVLTRVGTGIAGIVGGAAAGAAGGSVVPVAGTIVGAVVGGAVAWVATDYLMLRAAEYVNRDELRSEIIRAVDESFR